MSGPAPGNVQPSPLKRWLREPLGHLTEVKIRDAKVLASLKAGGQIDLTYVEGVAIAVKAGAAGK